MANTDQTGPLPGEQARVRPRVRARVLVISAFLFAGLLLALNYSFLLFHSLAELFSIVIGSGVFVIAWNARHFLRNHYFILLGVAYLFVAVLDLAHMLSYHGMQIFRGYDTDLPTQLWIASRALESLSFLAAPLFLYRRLKPELLLLIYTVITAALLALIFGGFFPACYIEGAGLTLFKRIAEYVISLLLVAAIILIIKNRDAFDPAVLRWLLLSLVLTIVSELTFTLYVSVFGSVNVAGHVLKIAAVYLVYKAVIETGLAKPYALLLREEKLVEQSLERLVQERTAALQTATDQLNAFVYSIAHDLRAPLRAQDGFGAILLEEHGAALGKEGKQCVQKITAAAERMDALVSDLLSYASVSSESPPLAEVDLSQVVRQAQASMAEQIQARAAGVETTAVRGQVLAHAETLKLAVQHLLDNALKFVPKERSPAVRLWSEQRQGWIRLWVEDNGIGIAPQYLEKLFGVFQRLHRASEYAGTGIGLALVKKSVERLGGRVGVESEMGKGSRFWVELKSAT